MTDPDALTVLRPGDRVLCVYRDDRDLDEAKQCLGELRRRFPGVEFSALVGADQVLVRPSEETP